MKLYPIKNHRRVLVCENPAEFCCYNFWNSVQGPNTSKECCYVAGVPWCSSKRAGACGRAAGPAPTAASNARGLRSGGDSGGVPADGSELYEGIIQVDGVGRSSCTSCTPPAAEDGLPSCCWRPARSEEVHELVRQRQRLLKRHRQRLLLLLLLNWSGFPLVVVWEIL